MNRMPSRIKRRSSLLGLTALFAFTPAGLIHAGSWKMKPRVWSQGEPHRGQYDSIREGLGPGLLPYISHGPSAPGHRYPKYPLFHAPIPDGPGDRLYETGLFPWQRG